MILPAICLLISIISQKNDMPVPKSACKDVLCLSSFECAERVLESECVEFSLPQAFGVHKRHQEKLS